MILAGDIGGTKTVIALFDNFSSDLRLVRDTTFPSKDHKSLEEILEKFIHGEQIANLQAGCFGVAGAVIEGKCRTTNLPWELDEVALAKAIKAPRVKLLNDLEAAAFGMLFLRPDEMAALNPDAKPSRKGNVAVIAAGTGLGEAMLYWDGTHHHPLASEGGHADFAAQTDEEIELLKYLRNRFGGHVSYERMLSGPGFYNIFSYLRDSGRHQETPALEEKLAAGGDPSIAVTQLGLAGTDPLCVATIDLFARIYGAEAGNLALKCVAVGGVFVGGGIAPKMLAGLKKGHFLKGFTDKGRFSPLMKGLEVNVALNPRAPLIGAAHYAARISQG
jgi:glucokinase